MRIITADDFIETYSKIKQRGLKFILSKFTTNELERTKSAFNDTEIQAANWWIIPAVKKRWNEKVTGDESLEYEDYVVQKYLNGQSNLKMLSLGSGICSHEIKFAAHDNFAEVTCIDISDDLLNKAADLARSKDLNNMVFKVEDINNISLPKNHYDVILFHSALHHFENVETIVKQKVKNALKPNGLLVLNDYVGPKRNIWTKNQLKASNKALQELIPKHLKKRFKSSLIKNRITGPGLVRMLLADPSEAVESDKIMPAIKSSFNTIEEKEIGGNILALVFKDIAHHFLNEEQETKTVLKKLFDFEDQYLETENSDIIFGVYNLSKEKV